jgi:hypothetical protein
MQSKNGRRTRLYAGLIVAVLAAWASGCGDSTQARSKWVRLVVVSPNNFVSPQATFTVDPATICV